ncbi:MAG: hypothetical protein DSZ07_07950 [Sulfurovum sp.]|nr:MAG: hypothetical protein DSZ07_07950 [Sulfurovum sp.]
MTLKSFFLVIFISSASISILFSLFTKETALFLLDIGVHYKINYKFISLATLISSTFSYIGVIISFYYAKKEEERRLKKREIERINLNKIHQELKALGQGKRI